MFDVGELPEKYAGWEIVAHEEGTFRDTILGISIMSTPLNALWPENLEYSMGIKRSRRTRHCSGMAAFLYLDRLTSKARR